jgi:tetratricopeptide (TPR) repeat protein
MITPENRTKFLRKSRLRKNILVFAVIAGVALAAVAGVYFLVLNNPQGVLLSVRVQVGEDDIKASWAAQEYAKVIDLSNKMLASDPYDFKALLYRGFSYFYNGLSQPEYEEKASMLARCTADLRKALVIEPYRQNGDIYYILGKAYYLRGYFYQDLSREYLKKAVLAGYRSADLNEYLGLVSSDLGDTKSAIEYFKKAIGEDPRDIVLLSLASAYVAIEDLNTAMGYVDRIIASSKDVVIIQKARFVRGDLLSRLGKTDEAIAEYESILRDNPNSADAHFFLGEVFAAKGDSVKARAQWREAYNIDPKHGGAVSRLNS